jgi:hypothetical protein
MRKRLHLVVIALFCVAVGSALAAPGPIKIVSEGKKVPPSDDQKVTASCDGGAKALGGGFKSPAGEAFAQVYPERSQPVFGVRWRVKVANGSFSESRRSKAFAICQRDPGSLEKELEIENVDPGETSVLAECDGADHLVGGGFAIGGDQAKTSDGTVIESRPLVNVDAWAVTFDSIRDDLRIRAYAICRRPRPSTDVVEKGPINVGPLDSKSVVVDCPAETPDVLNGGFLLTETVMIPIASWPVSDDAWGVTVVNPSGGAPDSFHAYALCQ